MSRYAKEVNRYLSKIKHGDTAQLKALFDLTANHLRIVAKVYLFNKSYADDVLIDVYQKAIRYIDSFDEKQDGYNWLCKITQRIAYTYNDKNNIFDSSISLEETQLSIDPLTPINDKIDLYAALNNLDEESKKIIIMYYFLGYTLEQIGQEFGTGKATIYKKIQKILKRLKNFL